MANSSILLPVLQSFLQELKSMNILKEYSLNDVEINAKDFSGFEILFKNFVEEMKEGLSVHNKNVKTSESIHTAMEPELHVDDGKSVAREKQNNVQLDVDSKEMDRRISAFLARKRKEVEEWNVQEFCSRPYIDEQNPLWDQIDSCARVDAVFIPRFGSKSHVKVSKVENLWGPQTQPGNEPTAKRIKLEPGEEGTTKQNSVSFEAMQDRIQVMESHLNFNAEPAMRNSIFQRLKRLEDRILFLEGLSPDYFTPSGPTYVSPKKKSLLEKEKVYSTWSVDDIQKRIQALKESLKSKSQNKTEYSG